MRSANDQARDSGEDPHLVEWDPPLRLQVGFDARTLRDPVVQRHEARVFPFKPPHGPREKRNAGLRQPETSKDQGS